MSPSFSAFILGTQS